MMRRRGFTIVEMLMVIAVLGILLGIVTTAASTAIRQARVKRAAAMRTVLQAGLATYYAQKGEWPGQLKSWCDNGPDRQNLRVDYLSDSQADKVFQELVEESVKRSQMLDVSGLFVAEAAKVNGKDSKTQGMDFRAAKLATKKRGKLSTSQLAFGYSEKKTGFFRRYIIKYNFETDSVTVMTQDESDSSDDYAKEMDLRHSGQGIRWPNKPNDGV
ncbi:MAG: type II secretion system protein [Kiritimatiellae bacterium]|nr:type II secretion system protein [Kiritimatiellia bacterium]